MLFVKNFSRLLAKYAASLESLRIRVEKEASMCMLLRECQLPPHLRKLSLYYDDSVVSSLTGEQGLLSDDAIETLRRGGLRSFKLHQSVPATSLEYLSGFASLVRLSIQLTKTNLQSFVSALGELDRLRAIELSGYGAATPSPTATGTLC